MVPQALQALVSAEVIVGYKTYLELIPDLLEGKKYLPVVCGKSWSVVRQPLIMLFGAPRGDYLKRRCGHLWDGRTRL